MRRIDVVRVQLVKEGVLPYHTRQVSNPRDAAGLVAEHVAGADREVFVLVILDTKAHVLAVHTVSIGTLDSSSAHPREVFKAAILANAASVILGHNHPSGDPQPSPVDVAVTRRPPPGHRRPGPRGHRRGRPLRQLQGPRDALTIPADFGQYQTYLC